MRTAKLVLAWIGLGLAVVSVTMDNRPLAWVAMAVLAAAFVLRQVMRRSEGPQRR
jgi:MYXO-CTERM domain-containing protein